MAKKMTIEALAGITQRGLHDVETRLRQEMVTKDLFKEGVQMVLEELRGFREETRVGLQAMRIEYAELRERVDNLEKRMTRVEAGARR